jgi:pyruvate kinase
MSKKRYTKIICTLGPAVDDEESIRALIKAGMNCARFNFSHGTHESHLATLQRLRNVRDTLGLPVAAMLDTKGPEIRTRTFANGPVTLVKGQKFTLTTRDVVGNEQIVGVTYKNLHQELTPGCQVLIDDGLIGLKVDEIQGQDIVCTVESGGPLSNHKSINLPGVKIQLPALTEQDEKDLIFACEQDFDYVAASFIRKASDVEAIRAVLEAHGGHDIRIISKIENQEGVDNMDEIIAASDGVMVARGDLGVEIPAARVPVLQKSMIRKCLISGKLVITATQMLDSMIRNPRPTRAEVSDVANAVFDGTSCVMLSGETASGKYPVEALTTMVDICREAEKSISYWKRFYSAVPGQEVNINDAITHSCCLTARDLNASAILCASKSGHTARMISRFRPACPIVALTLTEKVRRQLALEWGVVPCLTGNVDSTDRLFSLCAENAWKERLVSNGDTVVITAGVPIGQSGSTNLIKAQVIDMDE